MFLISIFQNVSQKNCGLLLQQKEVNWQIWCNHTKFRNICIFSSDGYLEPGRTSKMEFFAKIGYDFPLITIFAKDSNLYVPVDSEYASVQPSKANRSSCPKLFFRIVALEVLGTFERKRPWWGPITSKPQTSFYQIFRKTSLRPVTLLR